MNSCIDLSIYEDVKSEMFALLLSLPNGIVLKKLKLSNELTGDEEDVELYIVDDAIIQEFRVFQKRLKIEYSHEPTFTRDYSLASLVKVINFEVPSHYWNVHTKPSWTQVNNKDKVRARLEGEFVKWKNTILKNTKEKQKANGNSAEGIEQVKQRIKSEIAIAQLTLEDILENFERYDVRISGYHRRTFALMLNYKLTTEGKTYLQVALNKTKPNVLWFKELEEHEKIRTNNKLVHYLQKAHNPFGDVYYLPVEEEGEE